VSPNGCVKPSGNGICGYRQYVNATTKSCADCPVACRSCSAENPQVCLIGSANSVLVSEGKYRCDDGFYWNLVHKMCLPCGDNCKKCSSTACLECDVPAT